MIQATSYRMSPLPSQTAPAAKPVSFGLSADYANSLFGVGQPVVKMGFFRNLFNWAANLLSRVFFGLPDTVTSPESYEEPILDITI